MLDLRITVPTDQGPSLRSAIEELRGELGARVVGNHRFEKEHALTRAICALGTLGAAINAVVPEEDPNYD